MRKITKRTAAVVAASALAVGGAGAAWAAWTLIGTGSTTATAGSVKPLTVGSVDVLGLSPGNKSAITFIAQNPNAFPAQIIGIDITGISSGTPNCAANNVVAQTPLTLPASADLKVAGGTVASPGTKSITVPNAILMKDTAGDNCQGAVFTVTLKLDALSAAA